ncbi:integrase [Actimicrobium sp. GrIS 1.19]|uniref:tyrosine-type recombinase/integrase n=1 Tax=Actimicrobium sp. GrIS 1.19 TaxID=3071708 RepID=UPI002DFEC386|nr:integrase [Actimicrobium sp. GrIS 1.19]
MTHFSIREVKLPSGEQVPTLVEGQPLGLPVMTAMRYVLTKLRPTCITASAIRQKLRFLALAFRFFEERHIDLVERAAKQQFLSLEELVALSERCRLTQDGLAVVTPSYAAHRYATCIKFIEWTSEPVLARIDNDRRRYAANEELKRFLKRAKSISPRYRGHQSKLPGERLGFTPEQRAFFLECIKPGAVNNPFGKKLQQRNYAMFLLAFALGPRAGEILGLKVRDIDFQARPASLTVHRRHDDPEDPRKNPPNSKTLGRLMAMDNELRDALDVWISEHRSNKQEFPAARKHPYIFTNYRGEPLGNRGHRRIIEKLRDRHPIFKDVCQHILRHDFNERWVENTADADHEISERDQKYQNGWCPTSSMPAVYAKRAIRKSANRRSMELQRKALTK